MRYHLSAAEQLFKESGPIYHLCTKPLKTDILFHNLEEKSLSLNYIAIAAKKTGIIILAYSIMSNHLHFILRGTESVVLEFFAQLKSMLSVYYRTHKRPKLMDSVEPGLTLIESLRQLRQEIAYVIRKAFVVSKDVNVFNDPWSTGYLYFNPMLIKDGIPASSLTIRGIRAFTRSRTITEVDSSIYIKDGVACPWSYVDYELTMRYYDDVRQYIFSVVKNVEGQVEVALRYGEIPTICDDELYPVYYRIVTEKYGNIKPSTLDMQQRKALSLILKKDYFSSNAQISRMTGLPPSEVDTMFPLSAKMPK